jgi:hypothetical protein
VYACEGRAQPLIAAKAWASSATRGRPPPTHVNTLNTTLSPSPYRLDPRQYTMFISKNDRQDKSDMLSGKGMSNETRHRECTTYDRNVKEF